MDRLPNIHPGEILLHEFLEPMGISKYRLAKTIGVPAARIGEICAGKRSITADTALRLSRAFGTTAGFWLGCRPITILKRRRNWQVISESDHAIGCLTGQPFESR